MNVDNVIYVFDMDPPRRFGFSRGPDTDPVTGENSADRRDWPPVGQQGHTFHWFDQGAQPLADTVENLATNGWQHFKVYDGSFSGTWRITDLLGLTDAIRVGAQTLPQGQRNQMLNWANFLETDPTVPRVGDPV